MRTVVLANAELNTTPGLALHQQTSQPGFSRGEPAKLAKLCGGGRAGKSGSNTKTIAAVPVLLVTAKGPPPWRITRVRGRFPEALHGYNTAIFG